MLVVNSVLKDNEKNESIQEDNEMDSAVEKDHLEGVEVEEMEAAGDAKPYKPEHQYSREELLKYADVPLARRRPVVTDPNIDKLYCWISSGWINYNKRSDTPTERGDDSFKRRSNDPRDRVRKEQDGIVLSPQRRSFNSGCFVTVAPNAVTRPPNEPKDGPVRRIGSGRIITRDWDFRDKENDDGYPYRSSLGPNPRDRDDRYDMRRNYSGLSMDRELIRDVSRESLSREKDARIRERERLQRFPGDRRRYENEEPEWFSGGPTSQHDTIELRGFEDNSEGGSRRVKTVSKNSSKPNFRDTKSNTGSRKSSSEEISVQRGTLKESEPDPPAATSSPKVDRRESPKIEPDLVNMEEPDRTENHDFNFNLEDFLQFDNLPLLTNGGGGEGNQSSSRFSQWFRRDSPPDVNETRRSSIQDELIKNIINDINEPSINIPNLKESDAYFAPISPAGTTSGNSLLEMLQSSHQQNEHRGKAPSIKDLEATGKVTSVEELEARMRQGAGQSPVTQNSQNQTKKGISPNKKEEELIAFKKLLKQVVDGVATTSVMNDQASRPNILNQMLNKPPEPTDMMGQAHQPNPAASMHVPQDLVYKLLHVQEQQRQVQQQQEINKLLFSSGRLAPPQVHGALSPLPPELQVLIANAQPSPELLARPEAQAILQGLRQGEITPQHLIQQLQNPAMQPRHREVLALILKLYGGSPRPASPLMVPSDPALLQQLMLQQQLRIPSPLPPVHNGLPHRVPSPRQLMLHTQTIMQSALIKKKLEEQRENYRKRQEAQRATSPNVAAGAKSPNPASSTGTTTLLPSAATTASSSTATTSTTSTNVNNNPNNNQTSPLSANNNNVINNNNINALTNSSAATTTGGSNASATKSPTPLAFTPTSVLRKMTAEQQPQGKDGDGNKNKYNDMIQAKLQQRQQEFLKLQAASAASSRFLANNQLFGIRSPQQQWSMPKQPVQQPIQQGRAIVKGSGNYAPAPPPGTGLVDLPYGNNARAVYPQRSKLTMATNPLVQPNLFNNFPSSANRGPPNRGFGPQMGPLAQHNVNMNPALQQLLMSQNMTSQQQRNLYKPDLRNSFHQFLPGNGGEGDLSTSPTTSNQLAHWFTPELLAQAQAQTRSGKTDSTLNMVSVEELERLQQNSAPVLN